MNAQKESELDLLLLTQGWSRYDWNSIFNEPPKVFFDFEQGIRMISTINDKISGNYNLFLYSSDSNIPQMINLSENAKKIDIENYFIENGKELHFLIVKDNGKHIKPNMSVSFNKNEITEKIQTIWNNNYNEYVLGTNKFENVQKSFLADKVISLEEAKVVYKKKRKEEIDYGLGFRTKTTEIKEETTIQYPFVTDLIRSKGYDVIERPFGVDIRSRFVFSFGTLSDGEQIPQPIVYFDDVPITSFEVLYQLPTSEIKSIYVDKTGATEGIRGVGGVIRIQTRKPKIIFKENENIEVSFKHIVKNGFEKAKEYYSPNYSGYTNQAFKNFGAIHWIPEASPNKKGEFVFKVLDVKLKNLSFYIEGMGSDGSLLSTMKTLHIN